MLTIRLTGGTDAASMVNQPMMCAAPLFFRDILHELLLGFKHVWGIRKPQAVCDAKNMCIHRDSVFAEGTAHDDVRRLSSDAGQTFQGVMIGGHFAAEAGDQLPAQAMRRWDKRQRARA